MKHSLIYYPQPIFKKMIKFRMCNNYLPIETALGWYDREHRKCNLCNKRDIGALIEISLFIYLSVFANSRRSLLPSCYLQHPNCIVFKKGLNEKDELKLANTCNSSLSY